MSILLGDFSINDLHNRIHDMHSTRTHTHTRANRRIYFTSVETRRLVNQQTIERKIRSDLPGTKRKEGNGETSAETKCQQRRNETILCFFARRYIFFPTPSSFLSPTSATRCKLRFRDLLVFSPRMEAPTKGFQT